MLLKVGCFSLLKVCVIKDYFVSLQHENPPSLSMMLKCAGRFCFYRYMAKKKHRGHYCKVCGEYKSNESFSGKGHAQHICKKCMSEMKKGNKKVLDLPFGDNEFEIVDVNEYVGSILYGNSEERETKTFKKLNRDQKMVLKAIVQDEVSLYWQTRRQIPVNDKLKQLRSSVNTVVYEQLEFAIKDDTMFKAYIQEQVIAVINKLLRQENEQTIL